MRNVYPQYKETHFYSETIYSPVDVVGKREGERVQTGLSVSEERRGQKQKERRPAAGILKTFCPIKPVVSPLVDRLYTLIPAI